MITLALSRHVSGLRGLTRWTPPERPWLPARPQPVPPPRGSVRVAGGDAAAQCGEAGSVVAWLSHCAARELDDRTAPHTRARPARDLSRRRRLQAEGENIHQAG